jgi:beta-galactosidase GanA
MNKMPVVFLIVLLAVRTVAIPERYNFPESVEVTRRTKGQTDYYFILNHAAEPVTVSPGEEFFDLLAGQAAPASLTLKPFEYRVLRK